MEKKVFHMTSGWLVSVCVNSHESATVVWWHVATLLLSTRVMSTGLTSTGFQTIVEWTAGIWFQPAWPSPVSAGVTDGSDKFRLAGQPSSLSAPLSLHPSSPACLNAGITKQPPSFSSLQGMLGKWVILSVARAGRLTRFFVAHFAVALCRDPDPLLLL